MSATRSDLQSADTVGQVKQESRKTREGDTVTESDDTSVTVGYKYVNVFEDIDD